MNELVASQPDHHWPTTINTVLPGSVLPEGPVPIGSLIFADELPDGVVVADEVGRIMVFNRAAGRLTGLEPMREDRGRMCPPTFRRCGPLMRTGIGSWTCCARPRGTDG